jgi:hypothetical protein
MGATGRDLHIDAPLTNLVIGFEPMGTIVQDIFPMVNVNKQSNVYYVWEKGDFFRIPDTRRAPKTNANKVETNISSETYFCNNYALGDDTSFEDLANADVPIRLREKKARNLVNLLNLDWEDRVASQISSGSNVGSYTTLSGTSQWNDFANSDPVNDVEVGKDAIAATTGKNANLIIIPRLVMSKLKQHPDLLDRVKYTGTNDRPGQVTQRALAEIFGVERVLIGNSFKNTAEEGVATATYSDIWGKNVVIGYVTGGPSPDGRDPSLGYSFRWNSPLLGNRPLAIERWPDPNNRKFENIEASYYQDEKITSTELGYVIDSAVA